jgi:dynein assembly factor 3
MFKDRYDYRTNLVDWDYNMLLTEYAPIIHFYHYK